MRFRSLGISASNIKDYISKLKEKEIEYIEESALSHFNFISLEDDEETNHDDKSDDYTFLRNEAKYKIQELRKRRNNRRRRNKFLKKNVYFKSLGRKRRNSRLIDENMK